MSKQNKFEESITLIILGESSVGKTSLMKRFTENTFSDSLISTCGVELFKKILEINNKSYLIKIWDTCGQERFQEITYNYYKTAEGIILVYDTSNESTFDTLNKWINSIDNICDQNIPIIIAGNKIDLGNEISKEKFDNFNKLNHFKVFETSCKTGENINEMFLEIINQVIFYKNHNEKRQTFHINNNQDKKEETVHKKKCC